MKELIEFYIRNEELTIKTYGDNHYCGITARKRIETLERLLEFLEKNS